MVRRDLDDLILARAIHAGEIVRDEIEALGMSDVQFSRKSGIDLSSLRELLAEKRAITEDDARAVEQAIGLPAYILLRFQEEYERDRVRIAERNRKQNNL